VGVLPGHSTTSDQPPRQEESLPATFAHLPADATEARSTIMTLAEKPALPV
jgi:hypothetical protein